MSDALARSLASLTRRLAVRHESDVVLLARYTSTNDSTAFAELVRRHGPLVLGVCRRMLGHVHDAEDAFQATFLVLARNARSLRKPDALSAWLYGTALRVCRKALGKRSNFEPLPIQSVPIAEEDPFAETAWKEVRGVLDDEMGRLPESLRAPLILCYFDGLTRDEAAERLGCSRRTLMRRLEKGRERLRKRLEIRGVGTVGLGVAVLSSGELSACVSDRMAAAAVAIGTGGPVSTGVQALAGAAAAIKLLPLAMVLSLLLVSGGIGLATLSMRSALNEQALSEPAQAAPNLGERTKQTSENPSSLDADGQPLPAGVIHRLGSRRFRIPGFCNFILPTSDGRYVLVQPDSPSYHSAHGLMLIGLDTGLRVRSFEDGRRVPKSVAIFDIRPAAFSPDGKRLYALALHKSEETSNRSSHNIAQLDMPCKRGLLVWDAATGKKIAEWNLPAGGFRGASLVGVSASPDGERIYVYGAIRIGSLFDRKSLVTGIHVLDAATGKKLQTWEGAGYPAGVIAGGKEVIAAYGDKMFVHDARTGEPLRKFPNVGVIYRTALSPDGKTIAVVAVTGEDRKQDVQKRTCEIIFWESATGRKIRRLSADPAAILPCGLLFSADGNTLYVTARTGRILRWDVASGRALPDWSAHHGMIADLFRRPGKNEIVTAGRFDGAIHRWEATTGKALSTTSAYLGEIAAARTPDGKGIVIVDAAGRLDVWDAATGRITKTLQTPGRDKRQILFTPDGKHLLVAAQTGPSTIWDLSAGKQVGEFAPPPRKDPKIDYEYWWGALCFSPDGRMLAASKSGFGAWMWTWPERKILWHEAKEQNCFYFPDADTLVCGECYSPKAIEVRDSRTGVVKRTIAAEGLSHVAYSHDRWRMVTASLYGTWHVRAAAAGAVLKESKGFQSVWSVAFSPSGWLLAVAGDNSVRVYDTASWQEVARLDGHDGTVGAVFFGHDDATLISASAEDGTALVWSLKPPASREPPDPEKLWSDLAGDGPAVRRAVWAAAQHPDAAVRLFRQKWPIPQHPIAVERIRRLIGNLDSDAFAEREAAQDELMKLGRQAETELRKSLAESTSPEVKQRVRKIVDLWSPPATAEYPAVEARELRAVWALEIAGTAEAKKLLEEWATARVGKRLCEEAAAAVKRWQRNANVQR